MKFSTTKRIESKTTPGVAFVIRRITKRRRDEIDEIIEPIADGMPDRGEYRALSEERKDGALAPEREARWLELNLRAARLYVRKVQPEIVRLCLVRIEGLEIEGEDGQVRPATAETLPACCEDADRLWDEIVAAVEHERGLSADSEKNSESPSTSAAPEGGNLENAAPAGKPETTTPVAA